MSEQTIRCFYRNSDGKLGVTDVGGCDSYNEAIELVKENLSIVSNGKKHAVMALVK